MKKTPHKENDILVPIDSHSTAVEEARRSGRPPVLPVLPLSNLVLFPTMIAPLVVASKQSMKLVDDVIAADKLFITLLQRDASQDDDEVSPADLYEIGTLARVIKMLKFPDDTIRVLVQGVTRCGIHEFTADKPYLKARYEVIPDEEPESLELTALSRNASERFQEIITLSPALPEELKIAMFNYEDAGRLADLIASHLNMSMEERQELLEEPRTVERLRKLTQLLNREQEVLRIGSEIQNKVSEHFAKTQREFYLREQLKAIKQELGEGDQQSADRKEIEDAIKQAGMPENVRKTAEKELDRLSNIPPASPEYGVIRTYLDWLTEMPWSKFTEDKLDIRQAHDILEEDHYDLEKIKDRMLEYLSVLKLKNDMRGPILCFVGPPGVGKTSLGQSIARALGREFIRMSLGGVRDEAEIRGHRRTYIGAMPGRIIRSIRRAGTNNPVFMLDEVDKLGSDFRGDPSSALLEVLDPEQNFSFEDHYLDVPFDLSRVLFICTANVLDTIPPPLRDRMEILNLPGYTMNEKIQIARRYLVPKQVKEHGLTKSKIQFDMDALKRIVSDYTREAGVRNLEREIANVCRKAARKFAEGRKAKIKVTSPSVKTWLGPARFRYEEIDKRLGPGVATGLAWTPVGGDILFIESTAMPGKGRMNLTGKLGDVMKESAQASLSYVRANAKKLGVDRQFFENQDVHVHVPAGAIPKDGPSAGLAVTMSLISLLTGKSIHPHVAMTGEITLRGKVMPVGGIKEKVLAAARSGITQVILPRRNKDDISDVPEEIRRKIDFKLVETISAARKYAFE